MFSMHFQGIYSRLATVAAAVEDPAWEDLGSFRVQRSLFQTSPACTRLEVLHCHVEFLVAAVPADA